MISDVEKVIHHNDCTWCQNRFSLKKAIKRRYELERCGLTGKSIPAPYQGLRWCENYKQINCECEACSG